MAKKNKVSFKLKGMKKVARNLRKEVANIEGRSLKGMITSTTVIRRDMDKTPPLIPVDTNTLRSSYSVVTNNSQRSITFGFTANYAAKVHFNENANFKRRGAGPFFFLNAITRNRKNILKIISENAKTK